MVHSGSIIGDDEIARLARAGAALALVDSSGSLILWSTPAAETYFGLKGEKLPARLDDSIWPVERFAALAEGEAPLAGMALEPLRAKDPAIRPVTMSVRRSHLPDGATVLVVVLLSLRGEAVEPPQDFTSEDLLSERLVTGPVRFIWQSDRMGLWHFDDDVSPLLNSLIDTLDGATWPGRDARRVHDIDHAVRDALSKQETFVGLDAELLTQDNQVVANLVFSGTPIMSQDGAFDGYRGFGFFKPIAAPEKDTVPSDAASEKTVEDTTPSIQTELTPAVVTSASDAIARDETATLQPNKTPISKSGLSETERLAFREIARALGVKPQSETIETDTAAAIEPDAITPQPEITHRLNDDETSANDTTETSVAREIEEIIANGAKSTSGTSTTRPASSLHVAMDLVRIVLNRLPIGVMISRGDVPIVMNDTLLTWIGYRDADEFHAYGGIDRLFRGRMPSQNYGSDDSAMLVTRKDGATIALATRLQTVQWGDLPASMMTFDQIVETVSEPDEHILLEAGLVEAHELKAILDTATDGVIVMDEQGHILSLNRSAEALFGIEEISLLGDKFTALFSEDTRQRAIDYFNGIKENGVATILNDGREVMGLDDNGHKIPLFITLGRVADTPSQKYCVVLRDITTFKQTERELVEAKRKAETASTLKSDFLAKISHEVRTPLSAIIGFAEIMYEERFGPLGTTRYKDYLKDILKSGAHVVNLINDLLDLSKIEAGRADLDFTTIQPNAIVASSVKLLQNEAARRRVILRQSLAGNLPGVIADERSLTQIMLNILSNAIKFTDEGGQVIVSTARTVKGDLVIRVKDTGVGMSEQEVRTALEPFRQIKTSRHTGGTGLGLPLTKALVEANRASMTIISAKNAGTLVEITFPSTRVLTS